MLAILSGALSLYLTYAVDQSIWGIADASAWIFTGGLFGAISVYGTLLIAPFIGMARLYMCVVLGQLSSSLVYDHFGVLGVTQQSATPLRISGKH